MSMQIISRIALAFCLALSAGAASAAQLTQDPLTQLPLPAATDKFQWGNQPNEMPSATICKSQYQGNLYSLSDAKLDTLVGWFESNLKGFKHTRSADGSTHVFF